MSQKEPDQDEIDQELLVVLNKGDIGIIGHALHRMRAEYVVERQFARENHPFGFPGHTPYVDGVLSTIDHAIWKLRKAVP